MCKKKEQEQHNLSRYVLADEDHEGYLRHRYSLHPESSDKVGHVTAQTQLPR